ncbi:11S globulin seed storage protein 2-like [Bidens hawaiensis]|uniref:11S globulin seed storage protein 2-like n=1 Tax=Bidens hawaiensis TaxID=980011 RepID=UPI00404951F1
MVAKKVLVGFFLCLLGATATTRSPGLCDLQRLTVTKPVLRSEFEAGFIEVWNPNDDQYKCVGAFPSKMTMEPGSLKPPAYHHWPLLVFIEQGQGVMGMSFPGCEETFDTEGSHQKVFRVNQGDIIAIPAGTAHWSYNDGDQESVSVIVNDLHNPSNQLDMQARTFHLSGGTFFQRDQTSRGRGQRQRGVYNLYAGFDTELLAEVFDSDLETVRAVQESGDLGRGLVFKVKEPLHFDLPGEPQLGEARVGSILNGLEEEVCSAKTVYDLDNLKEADVFSRQAGILNVVNEHEFPVLSYMDLSAEKGRLEKNALFSPQWSTNSHTVMYVLNGDAQVQTVSNTGEAVFDEKVRKGDAFVIPQFFVSTAQAGQNGFEWIAFKTNKSPIKSSIAGHTSVFGAMPLDVITNAYPNISPKQAQNLKTNRKMESMLFSPKI